MSAGVQHACGLAADSTAYCWGRNDIGQLGDSTIIESATPVAVKGGRKFIVVAVGYSHTCALTSGGDAYCWGDNSSGQMGDTVRSSSSVPVRVVGARAYLALSTGASHTCAVATGNTVYCWGSNAGGQLGGDAAENCFTPTGAPYPCSHRPIPIFGTLTFAMVSAGNQHTCALTTGQVAYCWGYNSNGQLGDATKSGSETPVRVAGQ